jgi:hypothetical protein
VVSFTPRPLYLWHWIGSLVGPTAGIDDVEKRKFLTLPGLELRPLGPQARSQSLYRLRYPGSHYYYYYYYYYLFQKNLPHNYMSILIAVINLNISRRRHVSNC